MFPYTLHIMDRHQMTLWYKSPKPKSIVSFHDHWYVIYLHMYIILADVLSVLKHQLKCADSI